MMLLIAVCGLLLPCVCAGQVEAYISPDGYNASLNEDEVELRCFVPTNAFIFAWLIDGENYVQLGQGTLVERGIRYNNTFFTENNQRYAAIHVEPRTENNNTIFQCIAFFTTEPSSLTTDEVVFRVQGLLDPPTALETGYHNSTHEVLRWTAPFSLNLTNPEYDDITSYSVTLMMEDPPPRDPYDLSTDLPTSTSGQTWALDPSSEFYFPRYTFPVWLSVTVNNTVGEGASSPLLKITPPSPTDCLRLRGAIVRVSVAEYAFKDYHIADVVSDADLGSDVVFNDSAPSPSVTIPLYTLPTQEKIGKMCMDTVVVTLTSDSTASASGDSGSGGEGETHVLVPTLKGREISLILEPHLLDPHTHYTASLSFLPQHTISTSFSTHWVQDVLLEVQGSGLRVECVSAEGYSRDTSCTVVVEGEGGQWQVTFRGALTFPGLPTGSYTVRVYDRERHLEGSGGARQPAVEREVEVTGLPPSPSPTPLESTTPTVEDPTVDLEPAGNNDDDIEGRNEAAIAGHTLTVVIGVSVGCLVAVLVVVCLVAVGLVRRRCHNSSNYSVHKLESQLEREPPRAVNPILTDQRAAERSYEMPEALLDEIKESPYEVVDPEEKAAIERRRRERKEREAKSAAIKEPVFSEKELREIRRHTYSTVDLQKKKQKARRRESSPPPLPPQGFDYQEEFPEELEKNKPQTVDSQASSVQVANSDHVYDSLREATSPVISPPHPPQQMSSPGPPTAAARKTAGDPVYETISGLTVPSNHSPHYSSSSSSTPMEEEGEDVRLLPNSAAPELPARSPHMGLRTHKPVSSQNGSRHSMIEAGATSSPYPVALRRPLSVHITPHLYGSSGAVGRDLLGGGGRIASLPHLATSELKH